MRPQCTTAKTGLRKLTIRPAEPTKPSNTPAAKQLTDQWKERYKIRAGVEGTISQAVRTGMRHTRYIGQDKHISGTLTACAINLIRLDAWLTGTPLGATRTSHFAKLELAA